MENDASVQEAAESGIPSCESCRKRKLKCTRQQPACANCIKFGAECLYDFDRKKPGLKIGAVESLSRRLEIVEKTLSISRQHSHDTSSPIFVDPLTQSTPSGSAETPNSGPIAGVLALLTKEIHSLHSTIASAQSIVPHHDVRTSNVNVSQHKRRRADNYYEMGTSNDTIDGSPSSTDNISLPWNDEFLREVVDAYFHYVHPWISIIHEPSFRKNFWIHIRRDYSKPMIQAMIIAASRFVENNSNVLSGDHQAKRVQDAKSDIVIQSLSRTCIENVHALLILAYTEIVDDHLHQACSMIGLAVQQIENLQLCQEGSTHQTNIGVFGKLFAPPRPIEWIEEEERRRTFWIAFALDRFCAATTGSNPRLSGPGVRGRRLPTCASFWYSNRARSTPYLRISDLSTAALGHSLNPKQLLDDEVVPGIRHGEQGQNHSGVGALAFFFETVESMSIVVSHFLHQRVDFGNKNDVSRWLTRFQELDLYLLKWKMRLPQQWVDSGMSRRILPGVLDPAMAAANATHNTCLILLHEQIAYPDPALDWIQLPSLCSSDTCVNAAVEVSGITQKILEQRGARYPLSPQVGLCAFVSARTLLLRWRYYKQPLAPEFWILIQSLDNMAIRSQKQSEIDKLRPLSIFSRFAGRLRTIQAKCEMNPAYSIDKKEPLYNSSSQLFDRPPSHWVPYDELTACLEQSRTGLKVSLPTESASTPIGSGATIAMQGATDGMNGQDFQSQDSFDWNTANSMEGTNASLNDDNLLAISQALMGSDFSSMDRILSFDDTMISSASETPFNWGF